jgi:hypothetical protein
VIGLLVAMSCGGRVGYPGTLDVGVYRLDGAFVFGPGSFCASEAGAVYADRPLCKDLPPDTDAAGLPCSEWLRPRFPYPVEGSCPYADGADTR